MIGSVLAGKYRILDKIGSGGTAEVYKAAQIAGVHRTVAIKILKQEYREDAAFLRRFEQEAHAVLGLSHENIVRSYDVGADGGLPYIVLEYVEGSTLKECIRTQGRFQVRSAVSIAAQVLDALSHAHERGIIHRDVKPQNIIVNARGHAKLTDFGIARNADASTVTYAGANIIGSVHYLSPEQAMGKAVTAESDIYSMGITLYEMVTGVLPFDGDTTVSVALKHIQQEITPPIALAPSLPPALNDVILKATNKQPQLRYHSAREMRQDLFRVLREPNGDFARAAVEPQPPAPRKKRRPTRAAWRIAVVAAVLLFFLGTMLIMEQAVTQQRAASAGEVVPKLTGKTLEEASNTAKLRGYTLNPTYVASDGVANGIVISQDPQDGTTLKSGGVIDITVSSGAVMPVVPDVTGKSLAAAQSILSKDGIKVGGVEYRVSDAPLGTVFEQDPLPGTALLQGDDVQLYVSGDPAKSIEVPQVVKLPLPDALALLKNRGFSVFRVRLESLDNLGDNTVVKQDPAQNEIASSVSEIDLTAAGIGADKYSANIALTLEVKAANSQLLAVLPQQSGNIAYELVVYEAALKAGNSVQVSFPAVSGTGGDQTLLLYLNGQEIRRTTVMFTNLG